MESKPSLRSRAIEKLKKTSDLLNILSPQETEHLFHELQVHQIELEMQNEDLRSSQSQLEELLNRYTDLYDFAPIGYFTLDENGLVLEVNLKGAELLAVERRHLIGKPFIVYVAQADRARFRERLSGISKGGVRESYELKLNSLGGSSFDAQIEESIGTSMGGYPLLRMAILDITRQKQAEQAREQLLSGEQKARLEAQEANRLKDEFLATVSHELRTPLNAICGWANLLRTGEVDPETEETALETMERNAKAQEHLIDDLLDLSRIITGKLCLKARPLNLVPIIEAAIETVQQAAEAKEIEIKLDIDLSIGPVMVDPDRLQQVIWNLLSNAIKFTPGRGQVEIFLERVDSSVQIRVRDSGIGIPADFLPYVFDRFRQADGGNTRSYGGLGLGLAIVKHLVELHGGSVLAESPGEGRGTTLTVRLPIRSVKKIESGSEPGASLRGAA
ncbi:MAG: PAS domain S-box protein [Nitrospirae bacterium]|nr:PAS domain S-box protein [Candidatus Manganitrophaceae bacterium]